MEKQKEKILVVDDEAVICSRLKTSLEIVGFDVVTTSNGREALAIFRNKAPDLVVLDVLMPQLDGYGVCQELRKESDVPIIMLSALGDVADRIIGLKLGADDYIPKPFSPKELEARIRAILRRVQKASISRIPISGIIQFGSLQVDTKKRQVYKGNQRIQVTEMEFKLLELLLSHSGETLSRSKILQQVWGYHPRQQADVRKVDVYISKLRAKLEKDPRDSKLILTVRGEGYLFQSLIDSLNAAGA